MPHDTDPALRSGGPMPWLSAEDARLIERLHGGFPLVDRPFAAVADELGCGEDELLERLRRLLATGVLTRFGPLFQIERAGGRFVLAAVAVPPERFDEVAERVNAWPEVAHNYRRAHALNMWFVVAAESPEAAEAVIAGIEGDIGLPVLAFPKEREYFVELRLAVQAAPAGGAGAGTAPGAAHAH
jgi:DNA-binding Lrp family transcriptional regulator